MKTIKIKDIPPSRVKNLFWALKLLEIAMDDLTSEDMEYLQHLKSLLSGNG